MQAGFDCPNNGLASESAPECLHTRDDWQKNLTVQTMDWHQNQLSNAYIQETTGKKI
jgi:hypothetical protein